MTLRASFSICPARLDATLIPSSPPTGSGGFRPMPETNGRSTPKLTLDLGVHWDFYPPATPKIGGGFSNYDLPTISWC